MPFTPGHKINTGRIKSEDERTSQKKQMQTQYRCPVCGASFIQNLTRMTIHIKEQHPHILDSWKSLKTSQKAEFRATKQEYLDYLNKEYLDFIKLCKEEKMTNHDFFKEEKKDILDTCKEETEEDKLKACKEFWHLK